MAGLIIFKDGHAWGPAKWVYKNLLKEASKHLAFEQNSLLIEYIRNQEEMATYTIDLKELSDKDQSALKKSILKAVDEINLQDGKDWAQPNLFEGFKNHSNAIKDMILEIDKYGDVKYESKPKSVFRIKNNLHIIKNKASLSMIPIDIKEKIFQNRFSIERNKKLFF